MSFPKKNYQTPCHLDQHMLVVFCQISNTFSYYTKFMVGVFVDQIGLVLK